MRSGEPPNDFTAKSVKYAFQGTLDSEALVTGDFKEYWRFHLARDHQRLYPGTKQGQYTLGA